jgi:hypothetical protein
VRAVHIAAIVTAGAEAISSVAALIAAVVAVRSQRRTPDRNARSTEDAELQTGYQVMVRAGSTAQKEGPELAKINEAQTLINGGHYRAAIVILQLSLDYSLQEAIRRSNIRPVGPLRSSIQKAKALSRENLMDGSDVAATRLYSKIYNRAVCDFTEPSADDARLAVELIRHIVQSIALLPFTGNCGLRIGKRSLNGR